MNQLISKNPLVKKIMDAEVNPEIYELLLSRHLPFTEEEYLESLFFILINEKYKTNAIEQLKAIPESVKAQYSEKKRANHKLVYYILSESLSQENSNTIQKIIHNQSFPIEFLMKIAEKGNPEILEMLLENQIKLIAYPEIMDKMEQNPRITNFIRGKIKELKDFYLTEEKAEEIPQEKIIENIQEFVETEESSEEETEKVSLEKIQEKVVTTLQKINELSVPERIKLALTGTRTERMILIKDSNKMVSLSVIESPKFTEDEVIMTLRDRSVAQEIIAKIANNREWSKNYTMVLEMVQNPKTPLMKSLGMVKQLHIRDLKNIIYDKNVHYVVRNLAMNIYKEKIAKG